jgi:hypothetical protein
LNLDSPASELDHGPRIGTVVAGKHLDQSRFSGSVLTDEGVNLAAI